MKFAAFRQMMAEAFVKAFKVAQKVQERRTRHGTPMRLHRGKDRSLGPGAGATIRMLMRSNRAGFQPTIEPNVSSHGWYRRLTAKATLATT